uniref:Uncharacterized protein n=1 Tax=Avena sativa TaxID=4498 RepID=A0ACD5X1G3_AVESA
MRRLLRDKFGFPSDGILVLTEEKSDDPYRVPTRENLLLAMRWLVEECDAGDSLVFHFSGHGVQKLDTVGDEVDGYNEALCPLDFEEKGKILDDEINDTIVRPLGPGVKLHAIIDTCHSGTILDLRYLCRLSRTGYWQWENHTRQPHKPKGTRGGLAISISGCNDNQKSADSSGFPESAAIGAMTDSFIKAVQSEPGTTYGRLLSAMRGTIRDSQGSGRRLLPGRVGSFVRKMIASSSVQEPQLCSSEFLYVNPDQLCVVWFDCVANVAVVLHSDTRIVRDHDRSTGQGQGQRHIVPCLWEKNNVLQWKYISASPCVLPSW